MRTTGKEAPSVSAGTGNNGISQHIQQWAQHNDWYRTDIQTNQLRLEQTFGQAIEAITKDLDYQNQPKLRRQVFDCYDMLMAKCRQIDIVCRAGCRDENELFELHFLKSKAIAAATELAEVLGLLQNKYAIRRVPATDQREVDGRHTVSPIDCAKASVAATQCGTTTSEDLWMTFTQASEIIGVTKGTISKWAAEGRFKDNGHKGQKRRLLKASVLLVKHEREDQDLKKDAADLRRDMRKLA
jgi:hypothetical protein